MPPFGDLNLPQKPPPWEGRLALDTLEFIISYLVSGDRRRAGTHAGEVNMATPGSEGMQGEREGYHRWRLGEEKSEESHGPVLE